MKKLGRLIATAMATALLLAPDVARACSSCGMDANDKSAAAYKTSVLAMLAGPYVTVLGIGGALYLVWRKSKRESGTQNR
ncbi:MAG: hypothetical protein ACREQF_07770 [Candidatus Binataceae bacterium]